MNRDRTDIHSMYLQPYRQPYACEEVDDVTETDRSGAPATTVGGLLRQARTDAGRSIEQVSAATRIRAQLVRDLEDDRLDTCGGAVYARGHVRAIAHFLGVDEAPLVQAYDRQSGTTPPAHVDTKPVPRPRPPSSSLHVPIPAKPERRNPRWAVAGVATLAVLVALFAIGALRGQPQDGQAAELISSSAPPTASPKAVAPPPPPAPRPAPTTAILGLRVVDGRSWVSVRAAGKVLFEGTVESGWAQRFEDPSLVQVRIGNAGALRVSCGNGMGEPAGAVGVVLTVSCSPQGMTRP